MQKNVIHTLLFTESVWAFGAGLFFPIFAIFSSELGGDITDAGIAAGIFILVTSLLQYPIGKFLDTKNEKYFIVADYFLEVLVFVGYIFVQNAAQLFVLQAILGVANAIGDPAWESLYSKKTPISKSGSAWANTHLFPGILSAAGIFVGSLLVSRYGFSSVFMLGAVFSFSAGLLALRYIRS